MDTQNKKMLPRLNSFCEYETYQEVLDAGYTYKDVKALKNQDNEYPVRLSQHIAFAFSNSETIPQVGCVSLLLGSMGTHVFCNELQLKFWKGALVFLGVWLSFLIFSYTFQVVYQYKAFVRVQKRIEFEQGFFSSSRRKKPWYRRLLDKLSFRKKTPEEIIFSKIQELCALAKEEQKQFESGPLVKELDKVMSNKVKLERIIKDLKNQVSKGKSSAGGASPAAIKGLEIAESALKDVEEKIKALKEAIQKGKELIRQIHIDIAKLQRSASTHASLTELSEVAEEVESLLSYRILQDEISRLETNLHEGLKMLITSCQVDVTNETVQTLAISDRVTTMDMDEIAAAVIESESV